MTLELFPMYLKLTAILMAVVLPARAFAQHDDDHDHHHGALHFTHPLVTESPSPDSKIRVDYAWFRAAADSAPLEGRVTAVELEKAFSPSISLSVTVPYEWHTRPVSERAGGFGSTELSLKAVTYAQAKRGLLFGGGLSAGLPTGSDAKAIGSAHAVELEPFVHAAYMHHDVELVTFLDYSTLTRLRAGEENERELTFDGSALYHLGEHAQALVELESARALGGGASGGQVTSVAPGFEIVPFEDTPLMFGVSYLAGVAGRSHDNRQLLISAFYHF